MQIHEENGAHFLDNNQKVILLTTFIISCALSVIMSLLIFVFYILYSSIRKNFASQLIITISLMDFFTWGLRLISSIYTLSNNFKTYEESSHFICTLSGFLFSFFNLIVFFAVLIIGFSLFLQFNYSMDISSKRKYIFAFIFIISFILSCIPLITDSYGKIDDVKCWIMDYWNRIFTFYIILWIIFIIDFVLIIKVILKLRRMKIDSNIQKKLIWKFALFPILMFISWAPSSIRRLMDTHNFGLEVFMYAAMPLQGVFNPIAYGLINSDVKEKILSFFRCDWEKLKLKNRRESPIIMKEIDTEINDSNIN